MPRHRRPRFSSRDARLGAALVTAALIALTTLVLAPPAVAHSALLKTDPPNGAHLADSPKEISFTFSEDIEADFATVAVAVDGRRAYELATRVEGPLVVASIPAQPTDPGDQAWAVHYRVVSSDGHAIAGDLSFTVSVPEPPVTGATASSPSTSGVAEQSALPTPAETTQAAAVKEPVTADGRPTASFPWWSVLTLSLVTIAAAGAVTLAAYRRGRSTRP